MALRYFTTITKWYMYKTCASAPFVVFNYIEGLRYIFGHHVFFLVGLTTWLNLIMNKGVCKIDAVDSYHF